MSQDPTKSRQIREGSWSSQLTGNMGLRQFNHGEVLWKGRLWDRGCWQDLGGRGEGKSVVGVAQWATGLVPRMGRGFLPDERDLTLALQNSDDTLYCEAEATSAVEKEKPTKEDSETDLEIEGEVTSGERWVAKQLSQYLERLGSTRMFPLCPTARWEQEGYAQCYTILSSWLAGDSRPRLFQEGPTLGCG